MAAFPTFRWTHVKIFSVYPREQKWSFQWGGMNYTCSVFCHKCNRITFTNELSLNLEVLEDLEVNPENFYIVEISPNFKHMYQL